jgi:hypothetical protein
MVRTEEKAAGGTTNATIDPSLIFFAYSAATSTQKTVQSTISRNNTHRWNEKSAEASVIVSFLPSFKLNMLTTPTTNDPPRSEAILFLSFWECFTESVILAYRYHLLPDVQKGEPDQLSDF